MNREMLLLNWSRKHKRYSALYQEILVYLHLFAVFNMTVTSIYGSKRSKIISAYVHTSRLRHVVTCSACNGFQLADKPVLQHLPCPVRAAATHCMSPRDLHLVVADTQRHVFTAE